MPTVVVRFDPIRKIPRRGYNLLPYTTGHNRLWSFLPVCQLVSFYPRMKHSKDNPDDYPESCRFRVQIEAIVAFERTYNRKILPVDWTMG